VRSIFGKSKRPERFGGCVERAGLWFGRLLVRPVL
jgi:hypothetical protein